MLHVVPDGERRFRLIDHVGRERGWIRGRAVRFTGFASEVQVIESVRKAWRALESFLRRKFVYRPRQSLFFDNLRLVHDGAYEWISDGTVPVARLFRPAADGSSAVSYAIELVVPAYAGTGVTIEAARAMAAALEDPGTSSAQHTPLDAA